LDSILKPRILHVGVYNVSEGQESLRMALEEISSYYEEYSFEKNMHIAVDVFENCAGKFDVVFLQIQRQGVINVEVAKVLHRCGVKIYNFTGDVRQPIPKWYIDLAPYVTTLFTNNHDVQVFKKMGFDSHYFQIGYNEHYYNNEIPKLKTAPEIVFLGNNYNKTFPLGQFRKEMVDRLRKKYRGRFGVYGNGWGNGIPSLNHDQYTEGRVYRGCKIAINLSHFNLDQYSSDRMFRIMGCGAFCLTHKYIGIEKEFRDGIDVATWKTLDELEKKIDYYLSHDDERNEIAKNGNIVCTTDFTWSARMKQLLEIWAGVLS
jgi:glycosyltransferase involved in cell wall biosynthesis